METNNDKIIKKQSSFFQIKLSYRALAEILSDLDDGVLITDENGIIVFYNKAMSRIDNIDRELVIGKKITDIYDVNESSSPTMRCLKHGLPVLRFTQFYLTRQGRAILALQNVFPLFKGENLSGAINFAREYSTMEREMDVTSRFHIQKQKYKESEISFQDIIGNSAEFSKALQIAKMAATSSSPIMIYGESGTGKEMFAQAIHNYDRQKKRPFIAINCSAIPETLLEGILFGTSKGAFTDAKEKPGLFEDANGGSLFLDELNSLSVGMQAKLLRAVQEKKVRRVGSSKEIDVNVKIISSINEDPEQAIQKKILRLDLFYRLAVVYISIPPLRSRIQDIPILVDYFIHKCNKKLNKKITNVSNRVMQTFLTHDWHGNVRELEHILEGAMNMLNSGIIELNHLPVHFNKAKTMALKNRETCVTRSEIEATEYGLDTYEPYLDESRLTLFELQNRFEKELICKLLNKCKGNASKVAHRLGISRQLIYHKMKKHGIQRED